MWGSVDNGPRQGLDKFLKAASDDPDTVLHYEFMQDYKVLCPSPPCSQSNQHSICLRNLKSVTYSNIVGMRGRREENQHVYVHMVRPDTLLLGCRSTLSTWMAAMRRYHILSEVEVLS